MLKNIDFKSIKITDWLLALLLLVGFGLQLYLVYFGYITKHYLVPPGSDAIQHFNIIQKILTNGSIDLLTYPPGFHLIVIFLSKITKVAPFDILTNWTPVLMVLPAAAMYFLLRQLFDAKTSTLTTLILLFTSGYPIYGFIDGNYPDILGYGVFGILLMAFVLRFIKTKKWIDLIIASILLVLLALTHHLSFVSILIILCLFGVVQLYVAIIEKRFKNITWSWQLFSASIVTLCVIFSLYLSFKFYGPVILKFVNGFFNNNPAVQDKYLNLLPNWSDYPLWAGNTIWYLGIFGLLFVMISSFSDRKEAIAKQLVLVWLGFYFLMSRFDSSGLPARFARELAPPLTICIGFLMNYIFNINSLRIHRYKLVFGYGLMALLIVSNSALYTGPAKIPDSFDLMIWFTQSDQQDINDVNNSVPKGENILYNPYANLYFPIKASPSFYPIGLSDSQFAIADKAHDNKDDHYDSFLPLSAKRRTQLKGYDKLIYDLSRQYKNYKYIFVGVKPASNPDPKVYPHYAYYEIYNKVLDDLANNGDLVKKFPDGSRLYIMNH